MVPFVICHLPFTLLAQGFITGDFNQDGTNDSIVWRMETGSSSAAHFIRAFDGNAAKHFDVIIGQDFGSNIHPVFLPDELTDTPFVYLVDTIERRFMGLHKDEFDPQFEWMLGLERMERDENSPFYLKFCMPDVYLDAIPETSENFAYKLDLEADDRFQDFSEEDILTQKWMWIIHKPFSREYFPADSGFSPEAHPGIFILPHLLLEKQNDGKYKILFMTGPATGGPDKLRYPGIVKVHFWKDDWMIIRQLGHGFEYHIWMVNRKTGSMGRIHPPQQMENMWSVEIEADQLLILDESGGTAASLDLSLLADELICK